MDRDVKFLLALAPVFFTLSFADAFASGKPPIVNGEPATVAEVGSVYTYQLEAVDPEGDTLEYGIKNGAGWSWLRWDAERGRLHGEPTSADLGPYPNIVLTVSDGTSTTEVGPFTIDVVATTGDEALKVTDSVTANSTSTVTSTSTINSTSSSWRKKHPGHYVTMKRNDDHSDMISAVKPGVKGFQIRYTWKELEPWRGSYDFSKIRRDLRVAANQGMQLVVFVEDKSFNGKYPTPKYLHSLSVPNRSRGYTALRWKPYVVDRFVALLGALGNAFDSHPNFEGVAIQETALGIDDWLLDRHGYTPEGYRDAIIRVIRAARNRMPRSQVFWYMNFLARGQNYIGRIANVAAKIDVAMGGPDVLPDSTPLKLRTYPFYDDFRWRMTLFNSMQNDSYSHKRANKWSGSKYWKMNELFVYARDKLHVDYLFWNRKEAKQPWDAYNWWDALRVIDRHRWF